MQKCQVGRDNVPCRQLIYITIINIKIMLLDLGLKKHLLNTVEERGIISRSKLREEGMSLKTVKKPYGYDQDNVNRRIRELQQKGEIIGLNSKKKEASGNEYIVFFKSYKLNE